MTEGELVRDGDVYVLRFVRDLAYPVERVWRAITDRAGLGAWFPGTVDLELRVGGRATFANDPSFDIDPELLATTGEVVELDPMRSFAFTWGDDLLRFELSPTESGCRMVFTHRLPHRACANRTAAGWSVCLDAFADALGTARPDGPGWHAYYDRYAGIYGQDGTFSREADVTLLRFERLMPAPAERVWSALSEAGGPAAGAQAIRSLPPRALEHPWRAPGGVVKWQLIPVGEECLLLLTHTVEGDPEVAEALAGWDRVLAALATSLGARTDSTR